MQTALCVFYPPAHGEVKPNLQFAFVGKHTNAEAEEEETHIHGEKKTRRSNTHRREKGREDTHAQTLQPAFLQHLPI